MKKQEKKPNRWLTFSSLAFQIALIVWGSVRLGQLLEQRFSSTKVPFVFLFTAFGMLATVWMIYKQSKKFW